MKNKINKIKEYKLISTYNNLRLDIFLNKFFKKKTRNEIIKHIKEGKILVNNKKILKPSKIIKKKDIITFNTLLIKTKKIKKQKKSLKIVYEDQYLIIINKQNKIIVHPGAGNYENTILNSLMFYYPLICKNIPRCGIIHRLDKNTTGLIIIAKDIKTYNILIQQMKTKKIQRLYKTIVWGNIIKNGIINKSISRNKYKRKIMQINDKGKYAITYYKIIEIFNHCTLLKIKLYTGRTHQIRVHMNYINHPIIGEKVYINKNIKYFQKKKYKLNKLKNFTRQALHAYKVKFIHPIKNNWIEISSHIPLDMYNLIFKLRFNKNICKITFL